MSYAPSFEAPHVTSDGKTIFQLLDGMKKCILKFNKKSFSAWKKRLLAESRVRQVELWDLGVCKTPTLLDPADVYSWAQGENLDLFDDYGRLDMSPDNLDLFLCRSRSYLSSEDAHILRLIVEIARLNSQMKRMDTAYSTGDLWQSNVSRQLNVGVKFANGLIVPLTNYVVDENLIHSVPTDEPSEWKFASFNSAVRKAILVALGVGRERFGEGGFFVKGLSAGDEVRLLDAILREGVLLDGEFAGNDLLEKLQGRKMKLSGSVRSLLFDELLGESKRFLERHLLHADPDEVYVSPEGVFTRVRRTRETVTFGLYALNAVTGKVDQRLMVSPDGLGLTGEFVGRDEYEDAFARIGTERPDKLTILNRPYRFYGDFVVEHPVPIYKPKGHDNVELYDIYQTGVYRVFNPWLDDEIFVSLGQPEYGDSEKRGSDVQSSLKRIKDRLETSGRGRGTLRSSVVGGSDGLKEEIKCLLKRN